MRLSRPYLDVWVRRGHSVTAHDGVWHQVSEQTQLPNDTRPPLCIKLLRVVRFACAGGVSEERFRHMLGFEVHYPPPPTAQFGFEGESVADGAGMKPLEGRGDEP